MAVFRGFDQDSNHNIQIVLGLSGAELSDSTLKITSCNRGNTKYAKMFLADGWMTGQL